MRLLLLNTCGAEGSVALADTELDVPVIVEATMPGRTASERLVAVVREALNEKGWTLRDLAAIGVVIGPGSFTGVRVGLSVAKGLGEASGVPLIAVSRLAMLAAGVEVKGRRVCAVLDAGRGEFYCGEYEGATAISEALLPREDALAATSQAAVVTACEDAVVTALGESANVQMVDDPTAADALPLVSKRLEAGRFDDPMTLDANYLRRTDAEIFAKPPVKAAS